MAMLMRIKTRPTPETDRKKTLHGIKRERKRTERGVIFRERVIDSHGKVEYLTGGTCSRR